MELIILGKTSEEKGAELEKLCSRLFMKIGCGNVTLNAVGSGAAEYDVYAERVITNENGDVETIPAFAECKAYQTPCNNDHWQKFLGKYAIECARNPKVEAYFVALSGVNGNVWRGASDYLQTNPMVHIIAKDQLIEFVESEFHLLNVNQIRDYSNLYTNRAVDTVDLILLDNSIYWLVRFNSMDYTLFYSDGTPLTQENFDKINCYFNQKDFYNFIDLIAEKEHLERILSIKGFILSCAFMQIGDSVDKINEYLSQRNFGFTFEDVVKLLPDTQFVSDSFPFKLEDYTSKMELLNYLYSLHFISTVLTAPLYQSLFDEDLLDDILKIQGDFSLSCEERKNAIFLLKVSPAAVFNVITPDKFLVNASKNLKLFNGLHQSKAHQQLVTKLFNLLISGMISNMESQAYWGIAKSLGVDKYSFYSSLPLMRALIMK